MSLLTRAFLYHITLRLTNKLRIDFYFLSSFKGKNERIHKDKI
jgi:hypothetical protein